MKIVLLLLGVCVLVVVAQESVEKVPLFGPDSDGDGIPDEAELEANPHSMCYNIGHRLFEFVAAPLYYVGMVVYYLLYPLIALAEFLKSVAWWLHSVVMIIPRLSFWLLGWFVYTVWLVVSFLPWLLLKLILLLGSTVGSLILVVVALMVIAFAISHIGASFGIALALGCLFLSACVMQWGMGIILSILMCPVQFGFGAIFGVGADLQYWAAAGTLSYV